MTSDKLLAEARQLYNQGFAIHWLHKKSKRPIDTGWTTGPRKKWSELENSYQPGMNVGVRLGEPSKVKGHYLGVIDVDIKAGGAEYAKVVQDKLALLIGDYKLPEVQSGRGNGSRHYYILTPEPLTPFKFAQSEEIVKVPMPSVAPSKRELKALTPEELAKGLRLRPAWEVGVMGSGQQVVLPPSIHPDSDKSYQWRRPFEPAKAAALDTALLKKPEIEGGAKNLKAKEPGPDVAREKLTDFTPEFVEVSWLPISEPIRNMIISGEGVEDRSAMLLPIAHALVKAGLTVNEILSVLTDPDTYMGKTAYQHAQTKKRERAAAWLYKYTVKKAINESSAEAFFKAPFVTPALLPNEVVVQNQIDFDLEHDWHLDLSTTKSGGVRPTLQNTVMILENETCEDLVRRDLFSTRDFYSVDTPWGGKENEAVSDDSITQIKHWLGVVFNVEPPKVIIGEALTLIALRNAFDPVVEWLRSLPPWDGSARLDTWLKHHFNASGDDEYLAQVFRKWITAMVIRAIKPGTKFDWMPIFEGAQGVGKSSFGRILSGDKYFLDALPDLSNKDSALSLQGIWAVEMGELASFRKNEIEIVKSFVTRTVDKVRPPYGERWIESPRRCVFFGTTNFETYLRDESGNRRFKPVKVGRLDFDALAADREQLFAEALWLFDTGFESERTLEITGRAKNYEAEIQGEKMVADESVLMADFIRDFIESESTKKEGEKFDFSRFKLSDLFEARLGGRSGAPLKNWRFDSRSAQFAGKALKKCGGQKREIRGRNYWEIDVLAVGKK